MDRFDEMRGKNGSGGGNTGGFPIIIPPEAGNLTGIIISKKPLKVDYLEGESIDITGLEVTATYDNGVTGIVTGACEIAVDDPLIVGTIIVTVKYQEMEPTFNITVYGKQEEIPASTEYLFHLNGDLVNAISGEVETTSTFNSSKVIPGKFRQGYNSQINIANIANKLPSFPDVYNGAEMTIECWVKGTHTATGNKNFIVFSSSSRYIQMGWAQNVFRLNVTNNSIAYTLENSTGNWVHVAITMKGGIACGFINGKKIGQLQITIEGGSTSSLSIGADGCAVDEVLICNECLYTDDFIVPNYYGGEIFLEKIYLDTPPAKTTYQVGEKFSLAGAKINAIYSTGAVINVTDECVIVEDEALTVNDKFRTITYNYEGITKKLYINVGVYTTEEETIDYVDYIQSSGTQYIDTEIKSSPNIGYDITFAFTSEEHSSAETILGGRVALNNSMIGLMWNSQGYLQFNYGNTYYNSEFTYGTNETNYYSDGKNLYINGVLVKTANDSAWEDYHNIFLFAQNTAGTVGQYAHGKMKRCKIYDDGVLIRDFKPARDKNGVYCLYDEITGVFFYNKGAGTFGGAT